MKKNQKLLLNLFTVLVVLIALYAGYTLITTIADRRKGSEETQAEGSKVVLSIPANTVTGLSYGKGQDLVSVVKKGVGKWEYVQDPSAAVSSQKVTERLNVFANLTSLKTVEGGSDSDMGLQDPLRITLTADGSDPVTLLCGIRNDVVGGTYVRKEGSTETWICDAKIDELFGQGSAGILNLPGFPTISRSNLREVLIHRPDLPDLHLTYYEAFRPDIDYSVSFNWYLTLADGREAPADEETLYDFNGALGSIKAESCVTYKATEEDLAACGLKDPYAVYHLVYEEQGEKKTLDLEIGAEDSSRLYYYAREAGSPVIYLMSLLAVDQVVPVHEETLMSLYTGYVPLSSVSDIRITAGERSSEMILTPLSPEEQEKQGKKYIFTVNGKEVEAYDFTVFFTNVADPKGEKQFPAGGTVSGEPELTLDMKLTGNEYFDRVKMEYVPYDADYYALVVNGVPKVLMNKLDVKAIQDACEPYLE